MRRLLALALVSLLGGCLGSPAGDAGEGDATEQPNLWQRGLADVYATPPHVRVRDAAEREAGVAPPGDPRFAQFDLAMEAFMAAQGVPAAQLALMQDGRLAYASGYGHTKADGTVPTTVDTMFRLASVTKPMTKALVALQVEQGLYAWTDPVFCLPPEPAPRCRIPLAPHPDRPVVDPRIAAITVQDLVEHKGGWTRADADHLYRAEGTEELQGLFGTTGAPQRWQGAVYLMGSTLTYDPGTTVSYCNMCYMLASLVAEAATGARIGALFDAYLFRPLGVSGDIELGKAFPQDRNPREPFYDSDYQRASAYDPDQMVHAPDGGFNIEMLAATGGLVATAAAVAAVYEAYPEHVPAWRGLSAFGQGAYEPSLDLRRHGGLLDGTLTGSAWARDTAGPGGTFQYVFLLNDGSPSRSCSEAAEVEDGLVGCTVLALDNALLNLAAAQARVGGLA